MSNKTEKTVMVHNAYAICTLDFYGEQREQPFATFYRPQDWGDPRWHYEKYRFECSYKGTHYINNCHCWTDFIGEHHEYLQLFAPLVVQIILPGGTPQLCGNEYLDEEDFWDKQWGTMPPIYVENDDKTQTFYMWRVFHPDNGKPNIISGKNFTEPSVKEPHQFLITAEDDEGEFDGYLIATSTTEMPNLNDSWKHKGWLIEFKTEMTKIAIVTIHSPPSKIGETLDSSLRGGGECERLLAIATKTRCKNCGSDLVKFDEEFGFHKCEICSLVWALDEDDPDYDEVEENPPDEPT